MTGETGATMTGWGEKKEGICYERLGKKSKFVERKE
jgi:hypothetical protein